MIKLEKLASLMNEITSEKGELALFGLFLREDAQDKWDLVVAGPWLEKDKRGALNYISKKVAAHLTSPELMSLSRIVILEEGNPALEAVLRIVQLEEGRVEVQDSNFSGLQIKHAYIMRAKKP